LVLVAGGHNTASGLASAELYDPTSGTWAMTGSMAVTRAYATSSTLASGNVLVVGGCDTWSCSTYRAAAEIYHPATGLWAATGSLGVARAYHGQALLANGKVLVAGGCSSTLPCPLPSAELYDPMGGTWSPTANMSQGRRLHTLSALGTGKVL